MPLLLYGHTVFYNLHIIGPDILAVDVNILAIDISVIMAAGCPISAFC
jgi:hypothetical protein